VIVGGHGAHVLQRVIAYGDEWMPNRIEDPRQLAERISELGRLAEEAGRERPPITLYAAPAKPEVVAAYAEVGVSRYVFYVSPKPRDAVEERLDRLVSVIEEYRSAGS
jgi:hypothetical protein